MTLAARPWVPEWSPDFLRFSSASSFGKLPKRPDSYCNVKSRIHDRASLIH